MKKLLARLCSIALAIGLSGVAGALPYADSASDFIPESGSGVETWDSIGSSYTGPSGAGTYDPMAVLGAPDGVSLALGDGGLYGSIILGFDGIIIDEAETDLIVYDSFGISEGFMLETSMDGLAFSHVHSYSGLSAETVTESLSFGTTYVTHIDLGLYGISSASFIRLTAAPRVVYYFPEAFDLDAVEVLHYSTAAPVPEPSTILLVGTGLLGIVAFGRKRLNKKA